MKLAKRKAINYELIPPNKRGEESYKLLEQMRQAHHPDLKPARIALAWRKAIKATRDGHIQLGKCVKVSDLQRETAPYDFIILLNQDVWTSADFDTPRKLALLDHELCHAAIVTDMAGQPKLDERGRHIFRVRRHDIEEFRCIVSRHGCYKKDLEAFADAILARRAAPLLANQASQTPATEEGRAN